MVFQDITILQNFSQTSHSVNIFPKPADDIIVHGRNVKNHGKILVYEQGNGITEKLRQARIYQQSESLLVRLNLLCLSYCLIHPKVHPVFSLTLEKISFQLLQRSRAAWFLRCRSLRFLWTILARLKLHCPLFLLYSISVTCEPPFLASTAFKFLLWRHFVKIFHKNNCQLYGLKQSTFYSFYCIMYLQCDVTLHQSPNLWEIAPIQLSLDLDQNMTSFCLTNNT